MTSDWKFETAKLIAQFCGTLFIAWCAVRWALGRYKSEKMWEREVAAVTDIFLAIRELEEVNAIRLQEFDSEGQYTKEFERALYARDLAAREKLVAVSSVARLVLPDAVRSVLEANEAALLEKFDVDDQWIDFLTNRASKLENARTMLLASARDYLRS